MREGQGPKRVFLSHTAEMRDFPLDYSFVGAAESAVKRAECVVTDMKYFGARDVKPGSHCHQMVQQADVFVGIIGLRYGSPVRDRPDLSYTQLEFQAASDCGIPRFMFLLDDKAVLPLPAYQLIDTEHGDRQTEFRRHIEEMAGVMAVRVSSPQQLETELYHALVGLAQPDVDTLVQRLKRRQYAGLVAVHPHFDNDLFTEYMESAGRVTILNTWIPNLRLLEDALVAAVSRQAEVRLLLLNPNSHATRLRDEALRTRGVTSLDGNVKDQVERCLDILKSIAAKLDSRTQTYLEVRLYDTQPSVAIYRADDHMLISTFLHDRLAVDSPQFELDGAHAVARPYQRECETIWSIGDPVDPLNWRRDLGAGSS